MQKPIFGCQERIQMAKRMQRRYVRGNVYQVKGGSERERRMKFRGRLKMGRKEYLVFQVVRKASKFRRATR
jgi:hypothetical protein